VAITESEIETEPPSVLQSLPRGARFAVSLAVGAIAAVSTTLLIEALPFADDFIRAARPHDIGYWAYFKFEYLHWEGRWLAAAVETFVLSRFDPIRYYPLMLAAMGLTYAAAAYALCRTVQRRASRADAAWTAAVLLALLWAGMPSTAETVYWFTGGVENLWSIAWSVLLLTAIVHADSPSKTKLLILGVSAFCVVALHELYGLMLCLVLVTGAVAAWLSASPNRYAWFVSLACASLGLFVVLHAPGNAERAIKDGGPHGRQLAVAIPLTIRQLLRWSRDWIFDPKLIAASLIVAFAPSLGAARSNQTRMGQLPWRWILPPVWLVMLGIGFFAPTWAFGNVVPDRTLSGNYVVFVLGWLAIVYVWTCPASSNGSLSGQSISTGPRSSYATAIAGLLLAAALLFTGNLPYAGRDLYKRVWRWHAATEQRFAQLRAAQRRNGEVVLARLPVSPKLLQSGEISTNPQDYRNWGLQIFFRVKTVRLEAPTTQPGR
jgi:hypothetical protein